MKRVAIACENGQIFQHFGKTPSFLVAEVEGKSILSQEIALVSGEVGCNYEAGHQCSGHLVMVEFLAGLHIDVVVCGGMGHGAREALVAAGMEVFGGQEGSAEAALMFYANGDLRDASGGCCGHAVIPAHTGQKPSHRHHPA